MDKIWLSSPHMGGDEQHYIREAFEQNWIAPLGPNVTGFENDIQDYLGNDIEVAALSSGTAAIHLSLILLGVGPGDVVLCQTMTFSATANPIVYLGAEPVFVDSETNTWNICPLALEEAILATLSQGKKPKAIIAVHLYGMPFQVEKIKSLSEKYQIPIIEDSAEALGSSYKGKKCGTFGDYGILSFNGNKIITTSGGGALLTSSKEIKQKALFLATQARDEAPHYQHSEIGYNYRMSNISAGIGRGQMKVLNERVAQRRANHEWSCNLFEGISSVTVMKEFSADYYSNFWLTTILTSSFNEREKLRLAFESANIESRPLWKPMHLQPVFKNSKFYGTSVAASLFERGLCLPSGSNMTASDKNRIREIVMFSLK